MFYNNMQVYLSTHRQRHIHKLNWPIFDMQKNASKSICTRRRRRKKVNQRARKGEKKNTDWWWRWRKKMRVMRASESSGNSTTTSTIDTASARERNWDIKSDVVLSRSPLLHCWTYVCIMLIGPYVNARAFVFVCVWRAKGKKQHSTDNTHDGFCYCSYCGGDGGGNGASM